MPAHPIARSARLVVVVAVVASVFVVPVLPAVPDWLGTCAEAAPGEVRVGVVVDPGIEPDAPRAPEVLCFTVPVGTNGAQLLNLRADALGRPRPRWAPSGLLCAIDGYPSTGCGERTGGQFLYWSYWLGSGAWQHAGAGPAFRAVNDGQVEGWRFQLGSGTPSDAPPRGPASPAAICPPLPAPTTVPVPAPPPTPAPRPVPPASSVPIPGQVPPTGVGSPAPGVDAGGGAPAAITPDGGPGVADGEPDADPNEPDDENPGVDGQDSSPSGGSVPGGGRAGSAATATTVLELSATEAVARTSSGGAPPLGAIGLLGLVVVLGGTAWWRSRRASSP